MKGCFITVEGIEGVGKTTNLKFIEQYLSAANRDLVMTREPGGTPLAEEIRELLLANRDENFDATAELLLVFAARAQHIHQRVLPALSRGTWVVSDRFTDATYAYQGAGRQLGFDLIATLENCVQRAFRPDLTFVLDIDVELGLERARQRGALDRFEKEQVSFFERVRQAYLDRAAAAPDRYCVVDAGQSLENVQKEISRGLDKLLASFI